MTESALEKTGGPSWLAGFLKNNERRIGSLLQSKLEPRYFLSLWMSATTQNPRLLQCTQPSLMGAVLACAELGLEPNSPRQEVAIIPYRSRGENVAQVVVMRNGYVRLALRSGQVSSIKGIAVHARDAFEWDEAQGGLVKHKHFLGDEDGEDDPGRLICAYGIADLRGAGRASMLVPGYEVRKTKARALARLDDRQSENSPWATHEESMWAKTACKRICAVLLQHFEDPGLRRALAFDDAGTIHPSKGDDGGMVGVVVDLPSEPVADETPREVTAERPKNGRPAPAPKPADPPPAMTPEQAALAEYQAAISETGIASGAAIKLNRELHGQPNPTKLTIDQLRASTAAIRERGKAAAVSVLEEARAAQHEIENQ